MTALAPTWLAAEPGATAPVAPAAALPDLEVEGAELSPATVSAEGEVAVAYRVRNRGAGACDRAFRDLFVLSRDEVVDAGDVFLREGTLQAGSLAAGALSGTRTRTLTIPFGTEAGEYHVLVVADGAEDRIVEGDEANNLAALPITVAARALLPDLVVDDEVVVSADRAARGGELAVSYRLRNVGAASAATDFRDSLYLSRDRALDPSDVLVRQGFLQTDAIPPGYPTSVLTRRLTVPAALEPGEYFVLVAADGDGQVEEADESNNLAVSATRVWIVPSPSSSAPR